MDEGSVIHEKLGKESVDCDHETGHLIYRACFRSSMTCMQPFQKDKGNTTYVNMPPARFSLQGNRQLDVIDPEKWECECEWPIHTHPDPGPRLHPHPSLELRLRTISTKANHHRRSSARHLCLVRCIFYGTEHQLLEPPIVRPLARLSSLHA